MLPFCPSTIPALIGRTHNERVHQTSHPGGIVMGRFLLAAVVCVAVLYGVDAYWFGGIYKNALARIVQGLLRPY
jgi:hypothetical protein